MSNDYTTPLLELCERNQDTYQQVLNDCHNEIIDAFGGLDIMIQLCFTNPKFSTNKYKSQFDSFKQLMASKNINIDNKYKDEETTADQQNHVDMVLFNLEEFYNYSFKMVAYYSDSIYFVFLPTTTAKYIFDHVLHTKLYPVCCAIVIATLVVISQIYLYFFDYDAIFYLLSIVAYIMVIVCSLSYIFSANISVVSFIIQTFDFWYKVCNLILWIVSAYFVNQDYTNSTYNYAIGSFATACAYCLSFVIDATSFENKYKNVFMMSIVSLSLLWALYVYFSVDDTAPSIHWNPFEQYNIKYSRINFKSILVSSQINLCLFMLKPIYSQINHTTRKCVGKKKITNQSSKDDGSFVQQSYVLYKRPYIHWIRDCDSTDFAKRFTQSNTN